jgi:hypothetical protein
VISRAASLALRPTFLFSTMRFYAMQLRHS